MAELVSVIIPCYNNQEWIRPAIDSAVDQGLGNFEIIFIDDGSTDNSADIVQKEFSFVKLIKTENQGAAKARNIGFEKSKGEFIQFLDADDLLAKGKIQKQLKILKESKADIAYGNWQNLVKGKKGDFKEGNKVKRKLRNSEIDLFTDFWCPPAVYLFRRSVVERVGGFRNNLPIIQDARFVLDCALGGAKFAYCAGIMAYYRRHGPNSLSQKDSIAFHRDIYNNAKEIEQIWQKSGTIESRRKDALLFVYGYVARSAFRKDKVLFNACLRSLKRIDPKYIPLKPKHLRLVSQVIGYKRAESVAWWYRKIIFPFKAFSR